MPWWGEGVWGIEYCALAQLPIDKSQSCAKLLLNMVTNILLGALLLTIVGSIIAVRLLFRRFQSFITDFVTPAKEGEPSALYKTADAVASMLARAVVAQAKTTLMGLESGLARGEKALQGDMALDMASQNPIAGMLLNSYPKLSKSLRRNPELLNTLVGLLGKRFGSMSGGNGGGNTMSAPSEGTRFRL